MGELDQETILSAGIAAIGKRSPLAAAQDATELGRLARSLDRLNEAAFNFDLPERVQSQQKSNRGVLEKGV